MERDMMLKIIQKVKKIRTALDVLNTKVDNIEPSESDMLFVTHRDIVLNEFNTDYTVPSGGGWYRIYMAGSASSEANCSLNSILILATPANASMSWALPLAEGTVVKFGGAGTAMLFRID